MTVHLFESDVINEENGNDIWIWGLWSNIWYFNPAQLTVTPKCFDELYVDVLDPDEMICHESFLF